MLSAEAAGPEFKQQLRQLQTAALAAAAPAAAHNRHPSLPQQV